METFQKYLKAFSKDTIIRKLLFSTEKEGQPSNHPSYYRAQGKILQRMSKCAVEGNLPLPKLEVLFNDRIIL